MLRSIMKKRLKDMVELSKIQEQAGAKDIGWMVKKAMLNYAGHMLRDPEKWGKVVEEWSPRKWKRKQGRPTIRWRDELVKDFGILWSGWVEIGGGGRGRWTPMPATGCIRRNDGIEIVVVHERL